MAQNGLFCADVPLRNYSLTPSKSSGRRPSSSITDHVPVWQHQHMSNKSAKPVINLECRKRSGGIVNQDADYLPSLLGGLGAS